MLQKIRSILTLFLCFLLLLHLVMVGLLLSRSTFVCMGTYILSRALWVVFIAHLVMTFVPMLLTRSACGGKPYAKLNWRCYAQRITGILMVVLLHPHFEIFTKGDPTWAEKMAIARENSVQFAIPNAFYFIALIGLILFSCFHISVSIPKALVGLGRIVEEEPLARAEKICFISVYGVGAFAIWGTCMLGYFSGIFGGLA